jgi:hypothetical protein
MGLAVHRSGRVWILGQRWLACVSLAGLPNPFGKAVSVLFTGIFVVWLPAFAVGHQLTKDFPQRDYWKAALRGCPSWLRYAMNFFFGYAIVNFALCMFLVQRTPDNNRSGIELRMMTGHEMAGYVVRW